MTGDIDSAPCTDPVSVCEWPTRWGRRGLQAPAARAREQPAAVPTHHRAEPVAPVPRTGTHHGLLNSFGRDCAPCSSQGKRS